MIDVLAILIIWLLEILGIQKLYILGISKKKSDPS